MSNWLGTNTKRSSGVKYSCVLSHRHSAQIYDSLAFFLIRITDHLGSGQFGTVNRGLWQSPEGTLEVAVKTLKPELGENDRVKFLQEAAINGQFQHPNVVKLHGVVTMGETVSGRRRRRDETV